MEVATADPRASAVRCSRRFPRTGTAWARATGCRHEPAAGGRPRPADQATACGHQAGPRCRRAPSGRLPAIASARSSGRVCPSAGDTMPTACITIGIHEAQRGEAVEPGIGDLLDRPAPCQSCGSRCPDPSSPADARASGEAGSSTSVKLGASPDQSAGCGPPGQTSSARSCPSDDHLLARADLLQQGLLQFF